MTAEMDSQSQFFFRQSQENQPWRSAPYWTRKFGKRVVMELEPMTKGFGKYAGKFELKSKKL